MDIFISWIKEIVNDNGLYISIDGKAIKSARDTINGGNTPYIVSGFLRDIGISIGQVKVDGKSNEITAIPELLETNIIIWDTDYEKDHGRIEKRVYYLSYEIDCISDKTK